jgi:hypothetical protein
MTWRHAILGSQEGAGKKWPGPLVAQPIRPVKRASIGRSKRRSNPGPTRPVAVGAVSFSANSLLTANPAQPVKAPVKPRVKPTRPVAVGAVGVWKEVVGLEGPRAGEGLGPRGGVGGGCGVEGPHAAVEVLRGLGVGGGWGVGGFGGLGFKVGTPSNREFAPGTRPSTCFIRVQKPPKTAQNKCVEQVSAHHVLNQRVHV